MHDSYHAGLQARLERLESGLYTGASGRSGKAFSSTQDSATPGGGSGGSSSSKVTILCLHHFVPPPPRSFYSYFCLPCGQQCGSRVQEEEVFDCFLCSVQQESAWKAERAQLQQDKAALQRECRSLLERLRQYEAAVHPSSEHLTTHILLPT